MRLHDYAASGNCFKVRLLLALTARPYERVPVDIFAGDTLTPEYERLNPLRETPVLELDDGEAISQSPAILWYLAEGTPFLPAEPLERAQVLQWLAFEQEHVMRGVGGARFRMLTGREHLDPEGVAARRELGEQALAALDRHLARRAFVVGEACSIADLSLFAYGHVAPGAGIDLARFPAVGAWIARIQALPGFVDDFEPYPANSMAGAGTSIYG